MSGGLLDGDLEAGIFKILSSDGGVLSLLPATQISPAVLPEESPYPAIVFFRVDDPPEICLDGDARLCHPRVQVDAFATTARIAALVARAALLALENTPPGTITALEGESPFNPWNLAVNGIVKEDVRGPIWEPSIRAYKSSIDVTVWHND